ncbi:unannotated protein [freshwater metagenome]|uniref:Unannotated protein n=1 Tax=freshwater metagenome TaxID=449393 RepID=A0A6J6DDU4_9ZZZZ
MTRQTNNANVVAEVLAAELSAVTDCLRHLENFLFEVQIAESVPSAVTLGRQRVEVVRRGELRGFQRKLGRRATDDNGEVVRRARRRTDARDFLAQEVEHALLIQHRRRLLIQERLVRTATTFGHEH